MTRAAILFLGLLAGAAQAQPIGARWYPQTFLGGPQFELVFTNGGSLDPRVTFTRACTGCSATDSFYTDAAGSSFNTYADNAPVMVAGRGLLVEVNRINRLINSAVPVSLTTGSIPLNTYVFWCIGTGSVTTAAVTAVGSGFGAQACSSGTFQTVTISTAGTVALVVTGSVNRFQWEQGGFPTSFIQTAGATGSRAIVNASFQVGPPQYVQGIGTWFASATPNQVDLTNTLGFLQVDDASGTQNNRFGLKQFDTGPLGTVVTTAGVTQMQSDTSGAASSLGRPSRVAVAFNPVRITGAGGGAIANNYSVAQSVTPTNIAIGRIGAGSFSFGNSLNGWMRRVAYWNKPMNSGQLEAITAP